MPTLEQPLQSLLLRDYMERIAPTDKMPVELGPVLLGLYGEVGSIMATAKKYAREKEDYAGHEHAVIDEFGDVLWYLSAICRRLDIDLESIFAEAISKSVPVQTVVATDIPDWPISVANKFPIENGLDATLLNLGETAAALLRITTQTADTRERLAAFATHYLVGLQTSGISFARVAEANAVKTCGRFLRQNIETLPTFDAEYDEEERIPEHFEVTIAQRKSGKSYLQMNGIFLGDPLTDNIRDPDGYRFHDVFHLAHAAVLHWSPVFRALIKQKRKSTPRIDEAQDGGRAIVIEEGLTAWIFSRAKNLGYFAGRHLISFDMLKNIQQFVAGYEVEQCPLNLWESAILQGYDAFRQVRDNGGGVVIGDRKSRTLIYRQLTGVATKGGHAQ